LGLCGFLLLIASTSKQMETALRWQVREFAMLLMAPGIIFMLLTIPLREEDGEEEEDESESGDEDLAPSVPTPDLHRS